MFGNEYSEKAVLILLVVVFLVCVAFTVSIWLIVFFGLLAELQAIGVLCDMTTAWRE
ncbi:hypothetical protein [Williamsia sp.]|uniref:hypothetical protein n=1 Tax=Williamsia sp. TaxID=1872085 RepID=UPI002F939C38